MPRDTPEECGNKMLQMAKLVVSNFDVILSTNKNIVFRPLVDFSNIRSKIILGDEHIIIKYVLNLFIETVTSIVSTVMLSVLERKPCKVPTSTVDQLKTSGSHMDFTNVNVCMLYKAKVLNNNVK